MPRFKVTAGASCWSASRLDDARRGALAVFASRGLGDCLGDYRPGPALTCLHHPGRRLHFHLLRGAQRLETIRNHVSNVFTKLQVADRAEAIIRAHQAGLGNLRRR